MGIVDNFNDWRRYRRTRSTLAALGNRELNDMGIARWRIDDVAKGRGYDRNEVR